MLQNYINHISLVVDRSGSMQGQPVEKVFDAQLVRLKQRSIELGQETRISIYLFDSTVEVLTFDMDVMRFNSLKGYFSPRGQTALIDAVVKSIQDHGQLPQMYGDHAFLQYVITDGQENSSRTTAAALKCKVGALADNWTLACLVPDATCKFEAKKFGFPEEAISVWDTRGRGGLEQVGKQFESAVDSYMAMRARGVRGTKSFFTIDTAQLYRNKSDLTPVPAADYRIYPVTREASIKEFVEGKTRKPYVLGAAYYQPTKKVKVQDYKGILVQDTNSTKVYEGDNLRSLLGLPPDTAEVQPGDHGNWRIFIQSTSVNRKLVPGTAVLVMNG